MLPTYGACQLPAQKSLLLVQKLEGAHHVLPGEKKKANFQMSEKSEQNVPL
jgi:hypothetical protein